MPLISRDGMAGDDLVLSIKQSQLESGSEKTGEGVHDVQNAGCVSNSGVLAAVVQGLLRSTGILYQLTEYTNVKGHKFSGIWNGTNLRELQQLISS